MNVSIFPPEELIEASISLPLSKSISNRALVMNALTKNPIPVEVADCDDTTTLISAIECLRAGDSEVNVGPAGTAMRFFTALAAATPGADVTIDGNDRMRQRPIGPLVDALRICGAKIDYLGQEGFPPLHVTGAQLHGTEMDIDATISSQFISALVMVAPTFDSPLKLTLKGEISSLPYVKMTVDMMCDRGIDAELYANIVTVAPGEYKPTSTPVERDWSAASYWYEISAISAGWITLEDMSLPSIQGDSAVAKIFQRFGISTEEEEGNLALNPSPEVHSRIDMDLADNPDLAQTLAVACCMLSIPFHFTGLHSLRIKETDRLKALQRELAKLSFAVEIGPNDDLSWQNQRIPLNEVLPIDTHGDHRMAMAFAPAAIFISGLTILNAEVVSKSYPAFWDDMRKAGFKVTETCSSTEKSTDCDK